MELNSNYENELNKLEEVLKSDKDIWSVVEASDVNETGLLLNYRAVPKGEDNFAGYYYWQKLVKEVYLLLCTQDVKYEKERAQLNSKSDVSKIILTSVTTSLATTLGVAATTLSPFVALLFFGIIKLTKNAWCALKSDELEKALSNVKAK